VTSAAVNVTGFSVRLDMHLTATDPSGTSHYDFTDTSTTLETYNKDVVHDLTSPAGGSSNDQSDVEAEVAQQVRTDPAGPTAAGEFSLDFGGWAVADNHVPHGNAGWTASITSELSLTFELSDTYYVVGHGNAAGDAAAMSLTGPAGTVFDFRTPSKLFSSSGEFEAVVPAGTYLLSGSAYAFATDALPGNGSIFGGNVVMIPSQLPEPVTFSACALVLVLLTQQRRRRLPRSPHPN
jgi:hypothetical protein